MMVHPVQYSDSMLPSSPFSISLGVFRLKFLAVAVSIKTADCGPRPPPKERAGSFSIRRVSLATELIVPLAIKHYQSNWNVDALQLRLWLQHRRFGLAGLVRAPWA